MWVRHEYRGVTFEIGPRTPCPGVGWRIPRLDHLGRSTGYTESHGAFYDGADDHPEGAYVWAGDSAHAYIERMLNE